MRRSPLVFATSLAVGGLLSSRVSAQNYTFQYGGPIIIQDGFGVGGGLLPGDGLSYCVPSSTSMALFYLPTINPAFANFMPTNPSSATLMNFDRVMAGFMGTGPNSGTDWASYGVATYLATQGLGTANTSNPANLSTPYYTYTWSATPSFSNLQNVFAANSTYQNANVATVSTYGVTWYSKGSDGKYSADGGHDLTLTGAGVDANGNYSVGSTMIALNNPEPSAFVTQVADLPGNSPQIVNTAEQTIHLSSGSDVTGLFLQFNQGVWINGVSYPNSYGSSTLAGIDGQYILSVNKTLPTEGNRLPWQLTANFAITLNNGNLSVPTTVTDWPGSQGGLNQYGLGSLTLTNSVTTTGTFTLGGGSLVSTANPATVGANAILGNGSLVLNYGNFTLVPGGSGASASINLASGAGCSVSYGGGALFAINPGSYTTLIVNLGGLTRSGTTSSYDPAPITGTLAIAPTGGSATLGTSLFLTVDGGLPLTNGIVNPSIVAQDTLTNQSAGDFLTYEAGTGLIIAAYTSSTSTPITSATATTVYELTNTQSLAASTSASAYALKVRPTGALSGNSGSVLLLSSQAAGTQGGVILNGGSIAVPTLQFGNAEAVIYTGGAGGTIGSALAANGLTTFGPGNLILNGNSANLAGNVTVQSGTLTIGTGGVLPASAPILVNAGATFVVSGSVAGDVKAIDVSAQNLSVQSQNGGTVRLAGGTVTGSVSIDISSYLQGSGTLAGNTTINGTIAAGPVPAGGWTVSNPAQITFSGKTSITDNAQILWSLYAFTDSKSNGTPGVNWSTIVFNGNEISNIAAATLNVDLTNLPADPNSGNSFWSSNHTWKIINTGENAYGTYNIDVNVASYIQGNFNGSLSYDSSDNSYSITYTAAVPEPASMAGIATLGLFVLSRVRRRKVRFVPSTASNRF